MKRSHFPAGLLLFFAIAAILASVACIQYRNSLQRTQEATLKTNLFRMRDAIDQYHRDRKTYPATLASLVTDGYLRKVPEDPFTKSAATWTVVPADEKSGGRVRDVKSGAPGSALDGSAFRDW